jgi:hypothetical protein
MDTKSKRIDLIVIIVFLFILLLPIRALADDYYWAGSSGSWDNPANWNPAEVPGSHTSPYDSVYLVSSDGTNRTVYYSPPAVDWTNLGVLTIDGTGGGTMTLSDAGSTGFNIGAYKSTQFTSQGLSAAIAVGVNGTGIINQSGGGLYGLGVALGVNPGSTGILNISGGMFGSIAPMGYGPIHVGVEGTGIVNITGGNISAGSVHIGDSLGGTGIVNLSGTGNISPEALSVGVGGTVNQSGGRMSTGMYHNVGGTYNLSGGKLTDSSIFGATNDGTFNFSGGEFNFGFLFTNNGTTNLSGSGTRTISRDVVNNGTFTTTRTTAVYTGSFTNNGAYVSNRSTQYFNNLTVGDTGYLVGSPLDRFYISGDFNNYSTMNTSWNTSLSYLGFTNGTTSLHNFGLASLDKGATLWGFNNNFSWGFVNITGQSLQLYDGNSIAGGALYVGDILGLQISNNFITNITGMDGLNIYYLASLPDNFYLHGLAYDLEGGGHLIPINGVPEPTTMLLLGLGLIGLAGVRRKFKQ